MPAEPKRCTQHRASLAKCPTCVTRLLWQAKR